MRSTSAATATRRKKKNNNKRAHPFLRESCIGAHYKTRLHVHNKSYTHKRTLSMAAERGGVDLLRVKLQISMQRDYSCVPC